MTGHSRVSYLSYRDTKKWVRGRGRHGLCTVQENNGIPPIKFSPDLVVSVVGYVLWDHRSLSIKQIHSEKQENSLALLPSPYEDANAIPSALSSSNA